MMSEYIRRAGIVKGVTAKEYQGQYKYLAIEVAFETEEEVAYYSNSDKKVDEFMFTLPLGSPVNPGDVAVVTMEFEKPFGQRFKPALEVSNPADELDEDLLAEDAVEVDA